MFDGELISLLVNELNIATGLAAQRFNIPKWEVTQKMQPTQQGTSSDPSIFFQKLFDVPRGWAKIDFVHGEGDDVVKITERQSQKIETSFQITSLKWQDPEDPNVVTAADLLEYVMMYFQSWTVIQKLNRMGVRLLRVDRIDNPYFENDDHRFEAHPSFTLVLTYNKNFELDIDYVTSVESNITRL